MELYRSADGIRPEFMDLYMKFLRNRVWLQLEKTADINKDDEERLTNLLEQRIVNSLENNCGGFWTVDFDEDDKNDSLSIFIMFEQEEDLLQFLKTDAMMFRLEL
jgi:hypothetical protein